MKITLNLRKMWTASLVFYIICSSAFSYGSLARLNTIALYLFLGISLLNIFMKQKVRINYVGISLLLYLVVMLLGTLYSPATAGQVKGTLYLYITMAVLALCIIQYMEDAQDLQIIMNAFMLAGFALAVYVYSQYGSEFWSFLREAGESQLGTVDRLGGDLTNVNTIGMYTAYSVIIAVHQLIYNRTTKLRTVLYITIAAFSFVVSMGTASKKGMIVLILCATCMGAYSSVKNGGISKKIRNFAIVVAVIIVLVTLIRNVSIFSALSKRLDDLFLTIKSGGSGMGTDAFRFSMMRDGIEVWMDNLIFGAGTAASVYYFGVFSHNNFVEILMNSGLIGFVVFYGVYLIAGIRFVLNAKNYRQIHSVAILLFALFVSVTICSVGMVYYYDRYFMYMMVVVLSAHSVLKNQQRKISTEQRNRGE